MEDLKAHIQQKLHPFPVLETERLILRQLQPADFDALYRMRGNGRVGQFIFHQGITSEQQIKDMMARMQLSYDNNEAIAWIGERKGDGANKFIGACGFNRIDHDNHRAEIGGEMDTQGWGRFYSFEAVQAIVDFGLRELNFHTIEGRVWADNRSAIYLLEKLGFVKEAHFREYFYFKGKYKDLLIYTLHNKAG